MASNDVTRRLQDLTYLDWNERATSSGTAGTYLKARRGTGARMTYYKLSRYNGLVIDGHECVNEIVASRLLDLLGIPHLRYRLIHARILLDGQEVRTWLNSSRNFRAAGERKQALGTYFELHRAQGEEPYAFCLRMGWGREIKQMMLVDYLIANRDRHAANIEVLVDRAGRAHLAPIFDNGMSLVAPLAGDEEAVAAFDPLRDVMTANFVGSRSLEENLALTLDVPVAGSLAEGDRDTLLANLDGAIGEMHLDKIWDIVWRRWRHYEDLRDR